jgi:hypothetical protein
MKWCNGAVVAMLGLLAAAGCAGENTFGLTLASEAAAEGRVAGAVTGDGLPLGGVRVILVNRDSVETDGQGASASGDCPPASMR